MRPPYLEARRKARHQFPGYGQPSDAEGKFYQEEFLGDALQPDWDVITVNGGTTSILGVSGGGFEIAIVTQNGLTQDAVLDHGDIRSFDLHQGLIFETRLAFTVIPSAVRAVWGMAGIHNLDKDAIARAAWFLAASNALQAESDDTTNNEDNAQLDFTLVAGVFHVFTIDFRDLRDVKFLVDGKRQRSDDTEIFDMSNLTASEGFMEPYLSLDRNAIPGSATMLVDYVKIWQGSRVT